MILVFPGHIYMFGLIIVMLRILIYYTHHLTCNFADISMHLQEGWETVWVVIRWHPSDLDQQCFQKRIYLGSAGSSKLIVVISRFQ